MDCIINKESRLSISNLTRCVYPTTRGWDELMGRPFTLIAKDKKLRAYGLSYRKIGKKLGISEGMVRKGLK
jgi:hypothetical protein